MKKSIVGKFDYVYLVENTVQIFADSSLWKLWSCVCNRWTDLLILGRYCCLVISAGAGYTPAGSQNAGTVT